MSGIVGYIGKRDAYPILFKGLKHFEFRGYDSAGIAIHNGTDIEFSKTVGKIAKLEEKAKEEMSGKGTLGFAHTRWATHGQPNDINSHPHFSNKIGRASCRERV